MENQQMQQLETSSRYAVKENHVKYPSIKVMVFGIVALVPVIIGLIHFVDTSHSRASTPEELAVQIKFQYKWNIAQKEADQQWSSILKEAVTK